MQSKQLLQEHIAKTISLSEEEFDDLFVRFQPQSYKKGQTIITAGDKVGGEYFVISGCLKSFYINDDLKMFILQFAMPTWWTSDYNAMYSNTKATVNIDCITDAEVLFL